MKNTLETRLGVFVALIVVASVLLIEILGGIEKFKPGVRVKALFNSAQELKLGDRVKMAGVDVGKVQSITLASNKVQVTMKVLKGAEIKTDSVATIKFAGLMGENFVSLSFGSSAAPALEDNQFVSTAEQPDLSVIMQKIDNVATGVENLTKSFTGDKIDNLLGPFTDFLKQNSAPLTATIGNIRNISTQISQGKGTVGKLIYDDALYTSALNTVSNLQSAADEVKLTITDARKVIDGVNSGQGTVGKLLKDDTLYKETAASMLNLKEILQKVNQGQGTVGKLINDQDLYRNAKLTLQKVDSATDSLEDQGPLSVIGIIATKLF